MKALFVGLGSIGTRHLKNLRACCEKQGIRLQVYALRSSERALEEDVACLLDGAFTEVPREESFDVAFITNPTHLHAEALAQLKGRVGCFFIEKPIFESTGYSLLDLGLDAAQKAYVAAPMRWCGVFRALKNRLQAEDVYSVRAICSSYLPDWRPTADYRKVYSAHRDMGGGVALDLIHEWDYLTDLFGYPTESYSMAGKFSALEIDADDLAVYIARYPGFMCEVHLDYFGRRYRRAVEVFTPEGTLEADFGTGTLTLPDGTVEDYAEDTNRRFEREMEYFVQYTLQGTGESLNSPADALRVLQITLGGKA